MNAQDAAFDPIPFAYYLLLYRPDRIRENLERLHRAGLIESTPTLWQVFMGVLYMAHRMAFRPETIGQSPGAPVRGSVRARLLERRPLRLPFLLLARAIAPHDFTGLGTSTEDKIRHLLGAYHPGNNFVYDLQILCAQPGAIERLQRRVQEVVEERTWEARWLKDLTVYEGYHERLLEAVDRVIADGVARPPAGDDNPDTTLTAYLRWCLKQPPSPAATLQAALRGEISFAPRVQRGAAPA